MTRKILFTLFALLTTGSALAEKTAAPLVTWSFDDYVGGNPSCSHIDVYGYGQFMVYLDGTPYTDYNGNTYHEYSDGEYTHILIDAYPNGDTAIELTATAQEDGKEMSDVTHVNIIASRSTIVWGAFVYADGIDDENGLQVHICSDPSYGYDFLEGEMVLDGFMYQINNSGEWLQYDKTASAIYLPEYGDYEIDAYGYAEGHGRSAVATAWIHYDADGYTSYSQPRDSYYQYLVHNDLVYYIMSDTEVKLTGSGVLPSGPEFDLPHPHQGDYVIPSAIYWDGKTYTVVEIGDYAFDDTDCGTSGLTSVIIPNTVTSIGNYAFNQCIALTSIEIPNTVTSIGDWAFCDCSGLTSMELPDSIISIGQCTFCYCTGLTSIDIPRSVTEIGWNAFSWCSGLTSVAIPESVTAIGQGAFSRCSGLKSIVVEGGNTVYDSRNDCNAIIETASNTLITGCMNTVIPSTVVAIDTEAFEGCSGLTGIDIPNSVTSIGNGAFFECSGLTSIVIPEFVTKICKRTFSRCYSLISVNLPNSVTSIDDYAFNDCSSLTSINIPDSVTYIGNEAFWGCTSLPNITIPESVTYIGDYALCRCISLDHMICKATTTPVVNGILTTSYYDASFYERVTLFVPNESLETYRVHAEWGKFTHIVPFIGAGPGDINGDGSIAINDVTIMIDQLLSGDELPAYADVNGDGEVTIKDITTLIDMLLNGNN
ncbi:MAG: leucine-rich repeat protein [Muribaculaceae bacterium]|nr:leucine-rich repeat protein [Muribaculaceae bacterium]